MQVVTISLALISVVVNHSIMNTALICFFVIGILLNASALTLLIIAIFHKKLLQKLINFVVKIMKKIKIKNVDKKQEKIENELNKYQASSDYIKEHKLVMLKIVQMLLLKTQNGKIKVALPVNGQIELLELLEWQQYMT